MKFRGPEARPDSVENLKDVELSKAEQRLETWFQGPLYVATSSSYRLRRLSEMGFKDIHPVPIDEAIEKRIQKQIAHIQHGGHFDPYTRRGAAWVARTKCEALLERADVPPDAMVLAADTYPLIFTERDHWSERTSFWKPEQLHKPSPEASEDAIKQTVLKTLSAIWSGYEDTLIANEEIKRRAEQARDFELLENIDGKEYQTNQKLGHLRQRVEVHTGIAIRYPNQQTIESYSASAALFPERIYALVRKYKNASPEQKARALQRLTEQVLRIANESNVRPQAIPGCINWGDANIRRFLKAEEWNLRQLYAQKPEQGVYLGLPAKRLHEFLLTKAQELTK